MGGPEPVRPDRGGRRGRHPDPSGDGPTSRTSPRTGHRGRAERRRPRGARSRSRGSRCTSSCPRRRRAPRSCSHTSCSTTSAFRRLRATPEGLREVHVDVEGERFVEVLAPVGDGLEPLRPLGPDEEAIVPTGAMSFVHEALDGPAPRALLAIDYGSDARRRRARARLRRASRGRGPARDARHDRHHGGRRLRLPSPRLRAHVGTARSRPSRQHDALVALGLEAWLQHRARAPAGPAQHGARRRRGRHVGRPQPGDDARRSGAGSAASGGSWPRRQVSPSPPGCERRSRRRSAGEP